MSSIRTDLQPLGHPPPPLPEFIPPSHDQSVLEEPDALKEISLVLHRRPGATWVDRFPLSSETIMVSTRLAIETELIKQVKAFHPVFLDIVERISSQLEQLRVDREKGIPVSNSARDPCTRLIFLDTARRYSFIVSVPPVDIL